MRLSNSTSTRSVESAVPRRPREAPVTETERSFVGRAGRRTDFRRGRSRAGRDFRSVRSRFVIPGRPCLFRRIRERRTLRREKRGRAPCLPDARRLRGGASGAATAATSSGSAATAAVGCCCRTSSCAIIALSSCCAFAFGAGGLNGAQDAPQPIEQSQQPADDRRADGQLAFAQQSEETLSRMGERLKPAEAEESRSALDGVHGAKNLRNQLGIAGARLQVGQAPLHAVQPFLAFE